MQHCFAVKLTDPAVLGEYLAFKNKSKLCSSYQFPKNYVFSWNKWATAIFRQYDTMGIYCTFLLFTVNISDKS